MAESVAVTPTLTAVKPPRSKKGKREMEKREPKLIENDKQHLYCFGTTNTQRLRDLCTDLNALTKPDSKVFTRKRDVRPFEDHTELEYLARKNDTSLLMFTSHNKKRPNNMVIARMFDYHLLDMIELGVEECALIKSFKGEMPRLGSKPCLTFIGSLFETSPHHAKLKSILCDFFRGAVVDNINLAGLDHVLSFTATPDRVFLRHYRILLKKSGTRLPIVNLEEIGPSIDWSFRRNRFAAEDLMKEALKVPRALVPKKKKNIEHNVMGDKLGRIHMQKQDLGKLQTRKMKGLKRKGSKEERAGKRVATSTDAEDVTMHEAD